MHSVHSVRSGCEYQECSLSVVGQFSTARPLTLVCVCEPGYYMIQKQFAYPVHITLCVVDVKQVCQTQFHNLRSWQYRSRLWTVLK